MSAFEKNIINVYQEKGREWLADLPNQVRGLEDLWGLSQLKPFDNISYNYVLSGYQKEKPIVLKVSLDSISLDKEIKALEAFAGYGAVSVIAYQSNALLLQRALPGNLLKGHWTKADRKGIHVACKVMEKLHAAPLPKESHHFPHIEDLLATLDKDWELPKIYLQNARMLKKQLLQKTPTPVLLHGDLHQENILSNGDDWLVIDPKGVIGYPINEIWAFVEDPQYDLEYISTYFNFKLDEVVKWYYVHLILAACWQVEDRQDSKLFLDLAQSVLPMIKDE